MPLNQSKLHITQRALEWRIGAPDHFVASTVNGDTIVVPDVELAALHPVLPQSLRARIGHTTNLDPMRDFASNVLLKTTLRYLLTGGVQFRDTTNTLLTFAYIEFIDVIPHGAVDVTGAYIELKYSDEKVPFIMGSMTHNVRVASAELDAKYPGWHQRWLVGTELGFEHRDLMSQVFTKSVVPCLTEGFTSITFE